MPLVILCTYLYIEYWYYKEKFDLKGQGLQVFFHAPIMQPCILSFSFIFCIYLICTWAGQCALKIGPPHVNWYLTCKHQTKHFVSDKICAKNVPETVQWILREEWHSKAQKAILSERFAGAPCREQEISQGVAVSMYYSSFAIRIP